ncbi:MAG: cache domain-containing protein [Methanospirillum sp.]|jgi:cytochrome c
MKRFYVIGLILMSVCVLQSSADLPNQTPNTSVQSLSENKSLEDTGRITLDEPVAEMVAFVEEAVTYARDNKKEDVLAEFSNRNGSFFRGNLYIYAYDFDGITIAHPLQTELIGKSRLEELDAGNEYFIRNLRDTALNGSGFVVFHYVNPAHNNSVEKKLGFVKAVDNTWWLGSGIYGENVTLPKEVLSHTTC